MGLLQLVGNLFDGAAGRYGKNLGLLDVADRPKVAVVGVAGSDYAAGRDDDEPDQ